MNGKISTFGGFEDAGMSENEGLAVFEHREADLRPDLFLKKIQSQYGACKRLKSNALYFAYRFPLEPKPPRDILQKTVWKFTNPKNGLSVMAQLVDWGPHERTGRTFDVSPYMAFLLDVKTDDILEGNPI